MKRASVRKTKVKNARARGDATLDDFARRDQSAVIAAGSVVYVKQHATSIKIPEPLLAEAQKWRENITDNFPLLSMPCRCRNFCNGRIGRIRWTRLVGRIYSTPPNSLTLHWILHRLRTLPLKTSCRACRASCNNRLCATRFS